nr:hypothetical protein GCM10020093_079710 [Planobispora longispora]
MDAQVHRDLMTLARNNAICDAVVVSGDEDLAQVVCDAQDLGIRITLVHIAADGGWAVSRSLRQECDDLIEMSGGHLRPYVTLNTGVTELPALGNGSAANNGHQAVTGSTPLSAPAPLGNAISSGATPSNGITPVAPASPVQTSRSSASPPALPAYPGYSQEPSPAAPPAPPSSSAAPPAASSAPSPPAGHSNPTGPMSTASPYSSASSASSASSGSSGSSAPYSSGGTGAMASYQPVGPYTGPQPAGPYTGPQAAPVPIQNAATGGTTTLADAVKAAHTEGHDFGESVAKDAPALWLEAVLARKPRMPSDLEARLLQGSSLPIDFLLHDEVRHALRRGFWDALEQARR